MKKLARADWVLNLAASLLAGYLRLTLATIRWRREGMQRVEPIWDGRGPVLVCFWHSRIPISPACWPLKRAQTPRALISLSSDGELIAKTMVRVGFPAIRGSSRKASDPTRDKGGSAAFRETLRWLKAGNGIAITPDGPQGPVEVMKEGPPALTRMSQGPMMLVGLACKPCLTLGTWDQTVVPLPFGRGAIVWDGPFHVGPEDDLEAVRLDWAARLSVATRRAEAMVE